MNRVGGGESVRHESEVERCINEYAYPKECSGTWRELSERVVRKAVSIMGICHTNRVINPSIWGVFYFLLPCHKQHKSTFRCKIQMRILKPYHPSILLLWHCF